MSIATTNEIGVLSGDLAPYIGTSGGRVVLGKIVAAELATEASAEREVGAITLEVLEAFQGATLTPGQRIEVPMHRLADAELRSRNGFDHWNTINLAPGAFWLLAGRPLGVSNRLMALAAIEVESADAAGVVVLRQCYVIERLSAEDARKRELVLGGLSSPDFLLRAYALELLGPRGVYKRNEGVQLIAKALEAAATPPDARLELGAYLTRQYFFDGEQHADSANQQVVAALAAALVGESDSERRMEWANFLASCVLSELSSRAPEDHALRIALVRSVRKPTPNQVMMVLSSLIRGAETDQEPRLRELQAAWREAL
jgi:hypothetical protein